MSQPTHGKPKPGETPPGASPSSEGAEPVASADAALTRVESVRAVRTDTMLIHGVSDDGESFAVLRARDDRLEAGVVRKVKDGESLHGELLRLTPRPESPLLCDVEVQYTPPSAPATATLTADATRIPEADARKLSLPPKLTHGGPAQVATSSYRANWDAIWSKSAKKANQPN